MNVSGERTFAAPRATVWTVLNDPASMAKTIGCEPVGLTRGFTSRASDQPSGVCRATITGRSTSIESSGMRFLRIPSTR